MQNTAIVDAGPLIALFDASDKHHKEVIQRLEGFRLKDKGKLLTTWPVLSEVCYILHDHVHLKAQTDFIRWITQGGAALFNLNLEHLNKIIDLQEKYENIPMDLADATLLIVAQETGIHKIFSVDKDFGIYRILKNK